MGYEADFFGASHLFIQEASALLPRLENGQLLFHTPVLPYWLSSLGHLLLPDSPLGFRLLPILLALAALWGFFNTARQYLDARAAFYSCCVLAASLAFCWQFMLATPDSLLAISTSMALFGFYLYLKTRKKRYFWFLYPALAAGVLCKGLPALVLPVIIMVVYLMFKIKMDERSLKKLQAGKGFLLVFLLSAPWFIYAGLYTEGKWLEEFFGYYHVERYFGLPEEAEASFFLPFLYILLLSLPFGTFLPAAFGYSWKYKVKKDILMLSCLSLLIMLLFYGFSDTFFPHYLLAALPFAALLIGAYFSSLAGRSLGKMKSPLGLALLLLLSFAVPIYLYLQLGETMSSLPGLPAVLFYSGLGVLPLGTLGTFFLWQRKRTDAGWCLLSLSFLLFNGLLIELARIERGLWEQLEMILR